MADSVLTFKEIRDQVLGWLDETGSQGTMLTNVNNAINEAHRRRLTAEKWPFMLWDSPELVTMVDGQQTYPLHFLFNQPFYFFNRTKKVYLREVSARQLHPSGARWNTDQDTQRFVLWGRTSVANQPAASSTVSIVSTSASDNTAAKAIVICGITASGVEEESMTPSGLTPVESSRSFTKILSVTKSAAWAGTLTVTSDAGAVTNLVLLPTEYGRSYQQLFLLGAPTAGDVIEYRFYRIPKQLVNDNDVTNIPPGHEQLLVWDTLLVIGAYDSRLDSARKAEWSDRQKDALKALREATLEIQPIAAEAQYVVDVDEDQETVGPSVWLV